MIPYEHRETRNAHVLVESGKPKFDAATCSVRTHVRVHPNGGDLRDQPYIQRKQGHYALLRDIHEDRRIVRARHGSTDSPRGLPCV